MWPAGDWVICPGEGATMTETCPHGSALCSSCGATFKPGHCDCEDEDSGTVNR